MFFLIVFVVFSIQVVYINLTVELCDLLMNPFRVAIEAMRWVAF